MLGQKPYQCIREESELVTVIKGGSLIEWVVITLRKFVGTIRQRNKYTVVRRGGGGFFS